MQEMDNEMIARVWQRVHPQPQLRCEDLPQLVAAEQETAAGAKSLLPGTRGREREILRVLYRQALEQAASVRGLYACCRGKLPAIPAPKLSRMSRQQRLQRLYRLQQQNQQIYRQNLSHEEHGHVFESLARQNEAQRRRLLQLMGA